MRKKFFLNKYYLKYNLYKNLNQNYKYNFFNC